MDENLEKEAVDYLSQYLRINTTNPPGRERLAVEFLGKILGKEGISVQKYSSNSYRPNLLAKIKGNGEKQAFMLLNHMDVVAAEYENAFSGEVKDDYIHGRGALDMKGFGIMQLMTMILVKRNDLKLKRDLIFLAVIDEETGGSKGMEYLVNNCFNEIKSEYALSEGSFGTKGIVGKDVVYSYAVADKALLWLKLRTKGQPGHGSMPIKNSAINQMILALEKIRTYESKIRFTTESKEFFQKLSSIQKFPKSYILKNVHKQPYLSLVKNQLTKKKTLNAILKDTISITSLKAGGKENVIPETCEATLDCRLLPGKTVTEFIENLKTITGDNVDFEIIKGEEPASSKAYTEFSQALEEVLKKPLIPMISPAITDLRFLRKKGITSYGLTPIVLVKEDLETIHGKNEKISIQNLIQGTENTYEIVKKICT